MAGFSKTITLPMENPIYINGRFLCQPLTGVQRYAHELLNQFDILLQTEAAFKNIEVYCLVPHGTEFESTWKNIAVNSIGITHGNFWEQVDLPFYLQGGFLFSPANTGPLFYKNQILTIHDASVFAVPHAYSLPFRLKHQLIYLTLSRVSKMLLTDSKFSQEQLSHYLKQPAARYTVIPLSGDHILEVNSSVDVLKKYDLKKERYMLIVASQSVHKNLKGAEEALELINADVKFVFIGGTYQKVFTQKARQHHLENALVLGYVDDQELKCLYQNALGLLFPSTYEGFGLPVLEAMNCGCPVICARAASLPEVAGNAALYIDPADPAEIANAIDQIYLDGKSRLELIEKGYQHAKRFSWLATAQSTLMTLVTAAGNP